MIPLETINVKVSRLFTGDVIIDGSHQRLVQSVRIKDYATRYVFETITFHRVFGVKVWTTRKTIFTHSDDVVNVWHNILLSGRDVMKGDKVYHHGKLGMVNRIKRVNSKKTILSTNAGKVVVSGSERVFIAV